MSPASSSTSSTAGEAGSSNAAGPSRRSDTKHHPSSNQDSSSSSPLNSSDKANTSNSPATKTPSPPSGTNLPKTSFPPSEWPTIQAHPLLPPMPTPATLASEQDPYQYGQIQAMKQDHALGGPSGSSSRNPMPESCWTFCTQRQDSSPYCRMFCVRKRRQVLSKDERLARLRPQSRGAIPYPSTVAGSSVNVQPSHPILQSPLQTHSAMSIRPGGPSSPKSTDTSQISSQPTTITNEAAVASSSSHSIPAAASAPAFSTRFNISLDSIRSSIESYSFIYVRGYLDAAVGRYMEELEAEDGDHDFGMLSRGAESAMSRKRYEPHFEYLDWGDQGSLMHIPLISVLRPVLNIPSTLNRLFSPSISFLTKYRDSFYDGTQTRGIERFEKEIKDGSALKLLYKVRGYWEKKVKEVEAEMERERMEKVGKGE